MGSGTNKKRMKRRVLRVRPLLLLGLLVISICFLMGAALTNDASAGKESGKKDAEYVSVIVKQGDSIWGLIKEVRPDYSGNMQKAVYEVKQINGLGNSMIYPVQILQIPLN